MPTVRRTWFSGRIDSASMTGVIRNFWIATPIRNIAGQTISSETYGSMWISVNAQ